VKEDDVENLLRRAAAGDPGAIGEIARRYEEPVRAAIRRRLGAALRARVETDDLFQSTIVASLRSLGSIEYRGEEALIGWFVAMAERRIRDAARRHRAARRDVRRERPLEAAADRPADRTSPTQGAVRNETSRNLREAVDRLPEPDRQAVLLHTFEGLPFGAVAERLGLRDKESARHVFRRALQRMGSLLDGDGPREER
jgi:RNA polymerase sigma factor (sigma-70 family)